jgi:hypothetical protein
MSAREDDLLFDPFRLPHYLRLNDAIEQFTADTVAQDSDAFRSKGADIRHVAERQLFFATFADRRLFEYFVACETGGALPDAGELSIWSRQIAPYFRGERPPSGGREHRNSRIRRYLHRLRGRASVETAGCSAGPPQVLFLVIHSKFVRYLEPIAEQLSVPYAFLAIDDPGMFEALGRQNLPRIHIELTAGSVAMMRTKVGIFGFRFKPKLFDSWIIRLNAVRRALKELDCSCVVLPEGNAPICELVNQAAQSIAIPTLCVQQGWAPIVHPGFRNMTYTRMCVWGDEFAKLLAPHNPKQRFVSTGSHAVIYRPQGNIQNRKAIGFFLQNGAHLISEKVWRSMLDLIEWAAKTFSDYEIRVREHPGESLRDADAKRLKGVANVRLMPPDVVSLSDVFSDCRVAVAVNSTTILEAVASGVVPLILDTIGLGPYQPDIVGLGAAIEVKNFQDARKELGRLANDNEFCTSFADNIDMVRRRLFARNGEPALRAIVSEINQVRLSGVSS